MQPYKFCPNCAAPLRPAAHGGMQRLACDTQDCGFVHWDNPVPVVAAIVEHEGRIILARNAAWPAGAFALITGFLEKGETPDVGVQREVEEELGLKPLGATLVGVYEFHRMNQVIIAYHVPAEGTVSLNEELVEWKHMDYDQISYWPAGTGFALRDWLVARGYQPQQMEWPRRPEVKT